MGIKSEKKKISPPPKTATKPGIRSVSLTMGLENTNIADVLRNNSHPKILEWLQNKNLGDSAKSRTLCYHILKNTINGDRLVLKMLDKCVSANKLDNTDPDYKLNIDFSRLTGQEGSVNSDILKDLLSLKHEAAEKLLLHPVLETFVDLKWRSTKKYFFLNFLIYLVFLLCFSLFLSNIFWRPLQTHSILVIDDIVFPGEGAENDRILFSVRPNKGRGKGKHADENIVFHEGNNFDDTVFNRFGGTVNRSTYIGPGLEWNMNATFSSCFKDSWSPSCIVEIVLALCIVLLATIEILQLTSVGMKAYFTNFENLIEVSVIVLSSLCLGTQEFEDMEKWFSAFGIVLSYIELVFLLGRYPPLGGRISIMFYNITRHLTKSLLNLFILVVGFAFGFFIMHRNTPNDNFENPIKAIVKTLIMVLGEYEFNDMFGGRFDNMPYTRAFNYALLVLLAIVGSLVMVNLFVAIIVSDIDKLKRDGRIEETRQKIYHIINAENIRSCFHQFQDAVEKSTGVVCTHSICFDCKAIKVNPLTREKLEMILKLWKNDAIPNGSIK